MVNYQTLESFLEKRKSVKEENKTKFPEDNEVALGGVRNLNVAILVLDIADSSKFSSDDFIKYLSPFLHMVFHIVHENGGVVDKYTGDGAMISFCGDNISPKESCEKAIISAYNIADLAYKLKKEYEFPNIKIRIGLDYGDIKVERIGVRGKTHLIIVGATATIAKRLETLGKEIEYDQNATIMIGYDVYHNFTEERKGRTRLHTIKGELKDYFVNIKSMYSQQKPYKVYIYTGRIREK